MIREIVTYDIEKHDNPTVLTSPTRKVKNFKSKEVVDCVQDLNDTLDNLIKVEGNKRGAIGLSATQIGIDLAITAVTLGKKRYVLINPSLGKENGDERLFRIGCFSLYKYRAMVYYNDNVVINYYDPKGKKQKIALKGDYSCVVQHEMDHLVGDLLFANLKNKEEDLFVPRESIYKDGKVPYYNYGPIFEIRRRLGLNKVMSSPIYYSSLFNDYTDYTKFVEKEVSSKKEFIDIITKYTPKKTKVLEVGPTTSAISIYLNKNGYPTFSQNTDKDMYDLAVRINKQNKAKVKYSLGPVDTFNAKLNKFETIFSSEILETLDQEKLISALNAGLGIANKYVFVVPTLKIKANTLKGNERLKSFNKWKQFLTNYNYRIIDSQEIDNGNYACFVVGK